MPFKWIGSSILKKFWSIAQLASSIRNLSSAIQTAGIICSKFFISHLNGWSHPFEIFLLAIRTACVICSKWHHHRSNGRHHPFKIFSSAVQMLIASVQNFSLASRMVLKPVLNGWNIGFPFVCKPFACRSF